MGSPKKLTNHEKEVRARRVLIKEARLKGRRDMLDALKRVEWGGRYLGLRCPLCEGLQPRGCNEGAPDLGHRVDCALAAAISKAEGRARA